MPESASSKHSSPMIFRENSVSAYIFKRMVTNTLTILWIENSFVLSPKLFNNFFFRIFNRCFSLLWQFGQVVPSCVVRKDYFISFSWICDTSRKLFQKSLFNSRFNLRQYIARINFEVIDWTLTQSFSNWLILRWLISVFWTDRASNCVTRIFAHKLTKFKRIKEMIYMGRFLHVDHPLRWSTHLNFNK